MAAELAGHTASLNLDACSVGFCSRQDRMCSVQGSSGRLCTSLLTRLRGPTRLMAW